MLTANFKKGSTHQKDIVMHADGRKEVGNQPPMLQEKLPFEMAENECVISFMKGKKLKYLKVEDIKQKASKIYQ